MAVIDVRITDVRVCSLQDQQGILSHCAAGLNAFPYSPRDNKFRQHVAASATDLGKRFECLNDRFRKDMWRASNARNIGYHAVLHGSIPVLLVVGCYKVDIADLTGQKGPTPDAEAGQLATD